MVKGIAHIKATFNNTIITLTDPAGEDFIPVADRIAVFDKCNGNDKLGIVHDKLASAVHGVYDPDAIGV